jgi:hypothetical protein
VYVIRGVSWRPIFAVTMAARDVSERLARACPPWADITELPTDGTHNGGAALAPLKCPTPGPRSASANGRSRLWAQDTTAPRGANGKTQQVQPRDSMRQRPEPRCPDSGDSTDAFCSLRATQQPARRQTTPTAISESRKGLSGANPRHCGLTGPARDETGIAATLICLCLRVFHNHLRRWGLVMSRGATARVRHDFPTTHNAALRPYSRGRTHSGSSSLLTDVNLPALSRDKGHPLKASEEREARK